MLKGFKDFIMRGNVVDLAVGVVIGAAFTGVVTQLTKSFLEPVIKAVGGGTGQFAGKWEITEDNYMDWAGFLNALITFLLTAAVLYFLVVFPMNKLAERRKRARSRRRPRRARRSSCSPRSGTHCWPAATSLRGSAAHSTTCSVGVRSRPPRADRPAHIGPCGIPAGAGSCRTHVR